MKFSIHKRYTTRLGEYGINFLRWYRPNRCWSLTINFGQRFLLLKGGIYPNAGT